MQNTIGKTITNPSQMKKPLIWAPMDQEWKKTLEDRNTWWYKDKPNPANEWERIAMEKTFILRDRLLGFGGNIACMDLFDEDLEKIMERGQFWYGEHTRMKKGLPSSATATARISGMQTGEYARLLPDMHCQKTDAGDSIPGSYSR